MGSVSREVAINIKRLEDLDRSLFGSDVPEELTWVNRIGTEVGGEWIDRPEELSSDPVQISVIKQQRIILAKIRTLLGVEEETQMHRDEIYQAKMMNDYQWAKCFHISDQVVAQILGENERYIMRTGASVRKLLSSEVN